jgi:hypothetical protein
MDWGRRCAMGNGSLPDGASVNLDGFSLLFGAGRKLQELLNPRAEWSGVAVTLPHWIEMTPVEPSDFGSGDIELGEEVNLVDVANGIKRGKP